MTAALLQAMLTERLGEGAVELRSAGFGPAGLPPITDAVAAMRRRGLDVSSHRSASTTAAKVERADLVLAAERAHVVKVAALSPDAFRRSMTLPEFLDAASSTGHRPGTDLATWVELLTENRTAAAYLRADVPEVADPTGSLPRSFEAAVVAIEEQCRAVAEHVVAQVGS